MVEYSKESSEYVSNGHYKIKEVDFMSVYTFKKAHNMSMKEKNPNEGKELAAKCEIKYKTKPDFGSFDFVYVYPITELEDYYGV
jgi:hypothetical protein